MTEYIEREAAIDAIMKVYVRTAGYKARERVFEAKEAVHRLPVADVAPVVRCKDCKYYCKEKINGVICRHPALDFDTECFDHWINTNPDDFCSYGERKEGAD